MNEGNDSSFGGGWQFVFYGLFIREQKDFAKNRRKDYKTYILGWGLNGQVELVRCRNDYHIW